MIVGEDRVRRSLRRDCAGVLEFAAPVSSAGVMTGAESLNKLIFSLALLVSDARELLREVRDEGTEGARLRVLAAGIGKEKATAGRSGCAGSSLGLVWCCERSAGLQCWDIKHVPAPRVSTPRCPS